MVVRLRRQNLVTLYLSGQMLCFACLNQLFPIPLVDSQDEILAVFCLIGIVCALMTKSLSKGKAGLLLKAGFALALVESLGIISNGMSGLISGMPVLTDAFKLVKLPSVLFYVSCVLRPWEKRTIVSNLLFSSKCFILIAFLGGIVNLAVDLGFSYDLRYGIRSYKFIYENPAALNEVLLVSLVLIMLGEKSGKKGRENKCGLSCGKVWLLLYLATVAMTLRAGGIGASGILLLCLHFEKKGIQLTWRKGVSAAFMAFCLGYPQVKEYFFSETVRSKLLRHSLIVLRDCFPLGSGLATYGSDQAFKHYSPLYVRFGFHHDYALAPETGFAMNDNFWPMLLAQFGLFGACLYVYWLVAQFAYCLKKVPPGQARAGALGIIAFFLISSLGNPIFTSASGVFLAVALGLTSDFLQK
ncbi:polymerase [Lactobacillus sp.]|uniref:polymerase n=1 Tax=Lactobacillus sp. TaxID=1591 RepID=UPI003F06216D